MTSLIDVIFLLLLFFMLTSTFTRFGEIDLATGGAGGAVQASATPPVFLNLGLTDLRLNGRAQDLDTLEAAIAALETDMLLVSLDAEVTAQRLVDLLSVLRGMPDVQVTVLEDG